MENLVWKFKHISSQFSFSAPMITRLCIIPVWTMRASIFPQLSACDIVRIVPNINIHTVKLKLIKQHYYITKILHSEIRVIIIQVSKQQLPKSIHRCNDKP